MNDWMDETERLVKSLSVDMDPKKATKIQQKINVSALNHQTLLQRCCLPLPSNLVQPGNTGSKYGFYGALATLPEDFLTFFILTP